MALQEPTVREMAGVYGDASSKGEHQRWVELKETARGVFIETGSFGAVMSPSQCRRLAQQLYRLARRVDKRNEAEGTPNG